MSISSVVLSSQRINLGDAFFNVGKTKNRDLEAAFNPLVQDGKKLIPSVMCVFGVGREMFVYLQAYQQAQQDGQTKSPSSRPFFAFVSLYRGDAKVLETPPMAVALTASGLVGIAPLSFHLELNGLSSGEYDCQITVLDVSTAKTTFWRAPIVIIQQ